MNEQIVQQYEEIKVMVESLQTDLIKNSQGNKSAGVRARKGLRELKKLVSNLVKSSLSSDKGEQIKGYSYLNKKESMTPFLIYY